MTTRVEIVALPGPIGVEVRGVDASRPLDDETASALDRALDDRHLLLLRGRDLDGAEQVRWCRNFGPIAPEGPGGDGLVSNADPGGVLREGALPFHSDFAFTETPVDRLSLHALQVPPDGAPTVYADAVCILERVPRALRARLEGCTVVNVYDFTLPTDRRMRERDLAPGSPVVERPMVDRHRRTGAPLITANAMHTDRVADVSEDESEALLTEVFGHLYAPDNTLVLEWEVGDLVVWDNLALQHHRPDFPTTEPRTMQRVCVNEKSGHELVPNMAELVAGATRTYG